MIRFLSLSVLVLEFLLDELSYLRVFSLGLT